MLSGWSRVKAAIFATRRGIVAAVAVLLAGVLSAGVLAVSVSSTIAQDSTTQAQTDAAQASAAQNEASPEALQLPVLLDARVLSTPERARLVLDLSGPTQFALAALDLPNRIAVDVQVSAVQFEAPVSPAGTGLISDYKVELAEDGRGRAVLFLAGPAQVQQAYVLEAFENQPARLIVDLIPDTQENYAKRVADDLAASQQRGSQPLIVDSTPPGQSNVVTRSRPLVVIDPGHGGVDGGATAENGKREKQLVLMFAQELQRLLVAADRVDVALTRDSDLFLTLAERVQLGRANKADLFISIHADTFDDPNVRGASVYTRDERATDVLDKVLADGENKTDLLAGFHLPAVQPARAAQQVSDMLVELMRREVRRQSFIAAKEIVSQIQPSIRMRRYPIRQADFFVLQAPDMPAVLLELGFLSNAKDAANLSSSKWRDRTAEALARGINAYFDGLPQE